MKKYVFTIKDDVCLANGKDVEASELLAKMKLWGDVEDYDRAISAVKAEYQSTVDNLTTQIQAMEAHNLTAYEMPLLIAIRKFATDITEGYKVRINDLEHTLDDIKTEEENRIETIIAMLRGNA